MFPLTPQRGIALCAALIAPLTGTPSAQACSAQSGATQTALVELYTSEGCSSCPPADRWLSALQAQQGGGVSLAFHVDYWDYLGWRDRFAAPRYSQRQRDQVAAAGSRLVYTPQVMLNGRDFRAWSDAISFASTIATQQMRPAAARIQLELVAAGNGRWTLRLDAASPKPRPGLQAHLALYENGLTSSVAAGENRGERLKHDRVVRDWIGPLALDANGRLHTERPLTPGKDVDLRHAGIVAFIQDGKNGEVLQALDLPFCN
ncbi:MAG TPA: DUF1223 domain-containing protein [Rhodocyclaceae bacterium]